MNEFTVKKLAEVQAFVNAGNTILERGKNYGGQAPGAVKIVQATSMVDPESVVPEDMHALFLAKVAKTTEKLENMMDMYIGDEWDNPVEVLEWTSFFAGAGAAHAGLTASAAKSSAPDLSGSLASLEQAYRDLLDEVVTQLKAIAAAKA